MPLPFSALNIFVTVAGVSYLPADINLIKMEVLDSDEGDSEIDLECLDNNYVLIDSPSFKIGNLVSVKWGYVNGPMSQERKNYVLMKPSVRYSKSGVIMRLKAYTKSATLAARRPQKIHATTSVRQVVSEIANRNSLALNIIGGNEKLDSFSMANWSDRQTLRVLADRHGYQVSFSSEAITFAPVDYGLSPKLELIYGQGEDSNILDAHLNVNAHKHHGDQATTASSVDPFSKQFQSVVADDAQKTVAISAENGHTWLGGLTTAVAKHLPQLNTGTVATPVTQIDANTPLDQTKMDIMSYLSTPDVKNLKSLATGEKLKKQKKKGELSIVSVGMPSGNCRMIVTVKGLAKRDSGNWYTQDVRHDMHHQDGYTSHWELTRHGNNTKTGQRNTSPLNNQTPPGKASDTVIAVSAETGDVIQ